MACVRARTPLCALVDDLLRHDVKTLERMEAGTITTMLAQQHRPWFQAEWGTGSLAALPSAGRASGSKVFAKHMPTAKEAAKAGVIVGEPVWAGVHATATLQHPDNSISRDVELQTLQECSR